MKISISFVAPLAAATAFGLTAFAAPQAAYAQDAPAAPAAAQTGTKTL